MWNYINTKELKEIMETKTYTKVCPICKKEFKTTKYNQKYCSIECKGIAMVQTHKKALRSYLDKKINERNEIRQNITRVCPICNKEFTPLESHQKYCSNKCAIEGSKIVQKKSRQNRKEQLREYLRNRYHEKIKPNKEITIKTCPICGKEFKPEKSTNQKYCSDECKHKGKLETNKKYSKSEKGKLARKNFEQSEKGKAKSKRYRESEKGKETMKRFLQSEKGREYMHKMYQNRKAKLKILKESNTQSL